MDLIELAALERAGRLAAHIAWRWAEMHRPPVRAFCTDRDPLVGDRSSAAVTLGPGSPAEGGEVEERRNNVTPSAWASEDRT
jgi:hypothetical protein